MTISGFVGLLARHWLLAVACAVLGVTIAISLALFVVTPSYSATVKLYVSGTGATADDRLKNGEYARARVSTYADLVDSNEVLQAVRDNLAPTVSPARSRDLADSISASNPLNTLIIDVTVQDSSPQQAQAVAAAIGQAYVSVVPRLESPSMGSKSPVRVNIVSPPAFPTDQDSPRKKLYAAVGLLMGIAVGAGAAWLLEWRRRRASRGPVWPDTVPSEPQQRQENPVEVLVFPDGAGLNGNNGAHEWTPPWWVDGRVR